MIYEELKLPLPIYNRIEKQYRYMKEDVQNKVIASRDRILPWQFFIDTVVESSDITEWTIRMPDNLRTIAYNLTSQIDQIEVVETVGGKTYLIYKATDIGLSMATGEYHMELVVDGQRYYSEQFSVRCESPNWNDIEAVYTKIEWDNGGCDLQPIMYQTGFKNRVYLDAKIFDEGPTIEEEGDDNSEGTFIPSSQKYIDNLSLEDIIPFYLSDALVLMVMHKNKVITTPFSTYTSAMSEIKATTVREENTWLHRFNMTFQQISNYQNGNCCENIQLPAPPAPTCDVVASNLVITEAAGGIVSLSWNLIGEPGRIRIVAATTGSLCASGYVEILELPASLTSFQWPTPFNPNVLAVQVYPECFINGEWVSGTHVAGGKSLVLGPSCVPPDPGEPEEPNARVIVQNFTTDLPILDVQGISGYDPPVIGPLSEDQGSHSFALGTGFIAIMFDPSFAVNKRWEIFVNNVSRGCANLITSPAYYFISSLNPISATADIKIVISSGTC